MAILTASGLVAWAITGPLRQPSKELTENPGIRDQVIALGQFLVQPVKLAEHWLLVGVHRQPFCR